MQVWPAIALCSFLQVAGAGCCLATDADQSSSGGGPVGLSTTPGASTGGNVGGSTGGSSGAGTSSTGTATGATGGSTGGCVPGASSSQFDACAQTGRCGCPYQCVYDPLAYIWSPNGSSNVCESPCSSNSDCELSATACVGGICALVACGGSSGNGTYNSTCSMADGVTDGTCALVFTPDGGTIEECIAAGTSDGGCNPEAKLRKPSSSICIAGFICIGGGPADECEQECDNITVFCPPGETCTMLEGSDPPAGACY